MNEALSLETMDQHVGQVLGVSSWVRLDQGRIAQFAHCQPIRAQLCSAIML
jgi:hypothetical protein